VSRAVAKRPQTGDRSVQVADAIRQRAEDYLPLLGGDERARDRFVTVAIHAITTDPKVLQCEPLSIIEAVRDSASMGLELNGLMGEGYILPYGNKAQFQVGWRGLLRLARRSGDIAAIDAQVVYENDEFDVDLGSDPRITHRPALDDRGNRRGAYAYARLTSGELVTEWMPNADIEMVRRASRSKDGGPWVQWPDEMARKTVVKRLCKRLPLDSLAQRALEAEARADTAASERSRPGHQEAAQRPTRAVERVHARLGITSGAVEPSAPRSDEGAPVPLSGAPSSAGPDAAGAGQGSPSPEPGPVAEHPLPDGSMPEAADARPGGIPEPGPDDGTMSAPTGAGGHPGEPAPAASGRDGGGSTHQPTDVCEGTDPKAGRCTRAPDHRGQHYGLHGERWK
jgi:recombination protein RecT